MEILASAVICGVVVLVGTALLFSKKTSFDHLIDGTKDGIGICVNLLPTLIILMVSVSMLSASGLVDFLAEKIAPFCEKIGIRDPFHFSREFKRCHERSPSLYRKVRQGTAKM